jgi:hypothetical protein
MTESTSFTQLQDLSATFVRLVETAAAGIVAIRSDHARLSGFVWRPGLIVTADEVLAEEGDYTCHFSCRRDRQAADRTQHALLGDSERLHVVETGRRHRWSEVHEKP